MSFPCQSELQLGQHLVEKYLRTSICEHGREPIICGTLVAIETVIGIRIYEHLHVPFSLQSKRNLAYGFRRKHMVLSAHVKH